MFFLTTEQTLSANEDQAPEKLQHGPRGEMFSHLLRIVSDEANNLGRNINLWLNCLHRYIQPVRVGCEYTLKGSKARKILCHTKFKLALNTQPQICYRKDHM